LRIVSAGLTYHVWARGVGRMPIYRDDRDRRAFMAFFGQAFAENHVECHAHCLMANHYHAVITTREANLSRAIQELNSTYAQWWNRRHLRTGHVFQGRFGAQVVQNGDYLLTVVRYVVLNPVRAGIVSSPDQWPWSSYRATAGLAAVPPYLQPDALWNCLGGTDAETTCRRYREFVAMGDAVRLPRDPVIGDEAFLRRFEGRCRLSSPEVPLRDRRARPPLERLFADAIRLTEREAAALVAHGEGYSLKEIGNFLGVHYTTISKMMARATGAGLSATATTFSGEGESCAAGSELE
jgi:putative transposase